MVVRALGPREKPPVLAPLRETAGKKAGSMVVAQLLKRITSVLDKLVSALVCR
jgi:hypothetical protein